MTKDIHDTLENPDKDIFPPYFYNMSYRDNSDKNVVKIVHSESSNGYITVKRFHKPISKFIDNNDPTYL